MVFMITLTFFLLKRFCFYVALEPRPNKSYLTVASTVACQVLNTGEAEYLPLWGSLLL